MSRILYFAAIIILGYAHSGSSTIINIPADYPSIQQGIDAGNNGDTVLVQPGTYYENINFNGHNVTLASLFLTTGDPTIRPDRVKKIDVKLQQTEVNSPAISPVYADTAGFLKQ